MSSDETFLESFLESLSGLPQEIKRNLELMKDLDKSCSAIHEDLRHRHKQYIQQAEEKVMSLEVVVPPSATCATSSNNMTTSSPQDADAVVSPNKKQNLLVVVQHQHQQPLRVQYKPGVRVLSGSGSGNVVIIPTTEEMIELINTNPQALQVIRELEQTALQQADEKVAIADQTYSLVDSIVKRLDADLEAMEQVLQSTGELYQPNLIGTAAAGSSTCTGTGRGIYSTRGGGAAAGHYGGGHYGGGRPAKPNDLAAIQITAGSTDWILAKVISVDLHTGMYKLADEDVESNKIFHLPESQVVVLGGVDKLSRGDVIFAVYPDTTAFYQATVVQPPRKAAGSTMSSISAAAGSAATASGATTTSFVMVNFVDDSDEHGITHDKAVPIQHVMPPPYGVPLQ